MFEKAAKGWRPLGEYSSSSSSFSTPPMLSTAFNAAHALFRMASQFFFNPQVGSLAGGLPSF